MSTSSSRSATITDVAKAAGVSPATVSRVLNGHPRVNPELADRVRAAASAVSYVPNGVGRALRSQRSHLWAAIIPDVHNSFFTEVVEAFEGIANREGYSVVWCNSHEDATRERDYLSTALALQMSGVLLAATSPTVPIEVLDQAGIPVVAIDRMIDGFTGDRVMVDGLQVGQLAARHMLEQGCRNPLIVSNPSSVTSTYVRDQAFVHAMAEAGVEVSPERIVRAGLKESDARSQTAERLAADSSIDGVFAACGPLTSAAFLALQDCGREIPCDTLLVGVDDDHWTRMVTPKVTVVAQPVAQIGHWAGQLLLSRARDEKLDYASINLSPILKVRESSVRD